VIQSSNPILEAFGNARTVRNDNSSRFGKYLKVCFDDGGQPCGGSVNGFLLEKLRVTHQSKGERNYHVFYAMLAGLDAETKEAFALSRAEDYYYLAQGDIVRLDAIDDVKTFGELVGAFDALGTPRDEQRIIWKILAGILHLGNIQFQDPASGQPPCTVVEETSLQWASYLFEVDLEAMRQALTHRMIQTGGRSASAYFVPQNAQQAAEIRDALAQAMYKRIFDNMLDRVNYALGGLSGSMHIGLLDIFGFEIFENNSLEQLCINFANERLQQMFIESTIKSEQAVYRDQGLKWKDIKYHDNAGVCDAIDSRQPPGLFAILNDTCRQLHSMDKAEADAKFMSELSKAHSNNPHLVLPSSQHNFGVRHYAGDVTYDPRGMCTKNVDSLFPSLIAMIKSSADPAVQHMWRDDAVGKQSPPTTTNRIKSSAAELVKELMACTPSYIRCVKPNETRSANKFHSSDVLDQVTNLGILENVRVLRSGFAYREEFGPFVAYFRELAEETPESPLPADPRQALEAWISIVTKKYGDKVPKSEFAFGSSMIFISSPETLHNLEDCLFALRNPEQHAEKEAAAKVAARAAAKDQGAKYGKKGKCIVM
jgi:myosin-1